MSVNFDTNELFVQEARRKLNQADWDYLTGGSESETTMRRNRLAFDRIAFRPRVLRNMAEIDPSTTFLGQHLRIPVLLAPVGSLQAFHPDGAAGVSRAAAEFGVTHVVSSATQPSFEEVAAASPRPKIFQLYVNGDMDWTEEVLGRVKRAGYIALVITVDLARYGRRERPLLSGSGRPRGAAGMTPERTHLASLDWDKLDRIKEVWDGTLIVKGIQTGEDAELSVEHGVDVVWVSNHGGRQLDHGLGTMDTLPEVVNAVAGRAGIVVDGGVQRGTDILKAVAMGADAVAIGKLQGWALAAAGPEGVVRMLENLEDELVTTMGLCGLKRIDEASPAYVTKAEPVTWPHEMSSWVNMPADRFK